MKLKYICRYLIILFLVISCSNVHKEYYDSGELKIEYTVKNDKKNGVYKKYYKTGNVKYEGTYINDKEHGLRKGYYESGALKTTGNFDHGLGHGEFKSYFKNGILENRTVFFKDTIRYFESYDSLGNIVDCGRPIKSKLEVLLVDTTAYLNIKTEIFGPKENTGKIAGNCIVRSPETAMTRYIFDVNQVNGDADFVIELTDTGLYKIDIYYYVENDVQKVHDTELKFNYYP